MKNMKFKGTLIAILVIVIMVIVSKFIYKEDFTRDVTEYEPTEATFPHFEGTQLTVAPTEFETENQEK